MHMFIRYPSPTHSLPGFTAEFPLLIASVPLPWAMIMGHLTASSIDDDSFLQLQLGALLQSRDSCHARRCRYGRFRPVRAELTSCDSKTDGEQTCNY
jgi:hypothetical protein